VAKKEVEKFFFSAIEKEFFLQNLLENSFIFQR